MNPMAIAGVGMDFMNQIGKMGLGFAQIMMASKMNPQRPEYNIPQEVKEQLAMNRANLSSRMAGATQAERNIQQGASNMVGTARRGATDSSQLLSMAAAAQGGANQGLTNLASMEAQDRQRRLSNLNQSQNLMAGYRDKAFQLNEMEPYLNEARTKAALTQGGLHNMFGAQQDLGTGMAQVSQYMPTTQMNLSQMGSSQGAGAGMGASGYGSMGGGMGSSGYYMPSSQGAWGSQIGIPPVQYGPSSYYTTLQNQSQYGPGLNYVQGMLGN